MVSDHIHFWKLKKTDHTVFIYFHRIEIKGRKAYREIQPSLSDDFPFKMVRRL